MTASASPLVTDRGILSDRGGAIAEYWRPFVWSALFGGMITALGVQIIFTLFGIGIGLALGSPNAAVTDATPYPSIELGIASVLWLVVSGIISFGLGGWVAGRMSGYLRTGTGAMHGVAAWALAAVFGATVTAFAGAPVLGGAAAGAGAFSSGIGMQGNARQALVQERGAPDQTSVAAGQADEYRTTLTAAELNTQAEQARRAAAKAALFTGAAFLLSMLAAGAGGTLGRKNLDDLVGDRRRHPRPVLQTQ